MLCLAVGCLDQAKGQEIETITLNKYTQNEGLSSYYITKIIKDSKGFIWIGTQDGLNRFDGTSFTTFTKQHTGNKKLGGSYVSDIAEDTARQLVWVATTYGDICAIDLNTNTVVNRITTLPDSSSLSLQWIRTLTVHRNILWIGCYDGLFAYDIEHRRFLSLPSYQQEHSMASLKNVSEIFIDKEQNMWVGCDETGIFLYNSSQQYQRFFSPDTLNLFGSPLALHFWDVAENSAGVVCMATSWGIRFFSAGAHVTASAITDTNTSFFSSSAVSCSFATTGLLFACFNNSVSSYHLGSGAITTYNRDDKQDKNWLQSAYQVFCDRDNNVWIGTQKGIARFSLQQKPFSNFYQSAVSDDNLDHLYSLLPVNDSIVYTGDENGLYITNIHSGAIRKIDTAKTNIMLFQDSKGDIILSNRSGVFTVNKNRILPVSTLDPVLQPLQHDQLNCAIQYNDSIVCFSSMIQRGVSVWNIRAHTLKTFRNNSGTNRLNGLGIIDYLFKNRLGKLFVVAENSIFLVDPLSGKSVRYYIKKSTTGEYASNLMDMCETADSYYIATYGSGIIQTDKELNWQRQITTQNGLCNDNVYRLFPYHDSLLIASTNFGLAVINLLTHKISNYYESDGLHSSSFEQLCGYQGKDFIYAGGVNGFTIIDPSRFTINSTPPVFYFTGIQVQTKEGTLDTSNFQLEELDIPNDWLQTNVSFTGINYSNPARVTYRYRIKELNNNWIFLNTQHFVNLLGLLPGIYTLEVQSANEDGFWSAPKSITLHFLPKWYQTLLFKILVILAIAFIPFAVYRNRILNLKKQQQIRQSISGDLHDDIGATLKQRKTVYPSCAQQPGER